MNLNRHGGVLNRWGGSPLEPCDLCGEHIGVVVIWRTEQGCEVEDGIACLLCAQQIYPE